MGNDDPCKVIGIGTIEMHLHDAVVRTLSDVRYVPDIKHNLISLGTLESLGCRYGTEEGVLKVSRGSLVLMKANRIGSVLTGSVDISTSLLDSHNTQLWHMRLVHMGDKPITVLSKRGLLGNQIFGKLDFYEHCIFGKKKKVSFNVASSKGVLDYIYSYLWGPC
ncbi:unnamed protein product [Linum trigynum]|uniref:GAG-pre-integrase domain-containing protein n=1 Tax=Linum trigynum TaxID=586398 RepID=A0AAV2EX30_9ROSI